MAAPKLLEDGKRMNVYLDGLTVRTACRIGEGNMSVGLRRAVDYASHTCGHCGAPGLVHPEPPPDDM